MNLIYRIKKLQKDKSDEQQDIVVPDYFDNIVFQRKGPLIRALSFIGDFHPDHLLEQGIEDYDDISLKALVENKKLSKTDRIKAITFGKVLRTLLDDLGMGPNVYVEGSRNDFVLNCEYKIEGKSAKITPLFDVGINVDVENTKDIYYFQRVYENLSDLNFHSQTFYKFEQGDICLVALNHQARIEDGILPNGDICFQQTDFLRTEYEDGLPITTCNFNSEVSNDNFSLSIKAEKVREEDLDVLIDSSKVNIPIGTLELLNNIGENIVLNKISGNFRIVQKHGDRILDDLKMHAGKFGSFVRSRLKDSSVVTINPNNWSYEQNIRDEKGNKAFMLHVSEVDDKNPNIEMNASSSSGFGEFPSLDDAYKQANKEYQKSLGVLPTWLKRK